ncbi:MAG: FadR/GntR family transcriptional regulator [Anaerolineales bacterium]
MHGAQFTSIFLEYLARRGADGKTDGCQLPSLSQLSEALGVSVSQLREQVEVARAIGLIDVRPRTGIRRLPYTFFPAIKLSLAYALSLDQDYFESFADLRRHIESSYWDKAVRRLTSEDLDELDGLIKKAFIKLNSSPVQIPHDEHRQVHLLIFSRLNNPFVSGILEAYWDAYEAVGLNTYADYEYLVEVWNYHQQMVASIRIGDFEDSYHALIEHTELINHRPTLDKARVAATIDMESSVPPSNS